MNWNWLNENGDMLPQVLKVIDDVTKAGRAPREVHVSDKVFDLLKKALMRMPTDERRRLDSIPKEPTRLQEGPIVVVQLRGIPIFPQEMPTWLAVPIVPSPETKAAVLGYDQRIANPIRK